MDVCLPRNTPIPTRKEKTGFTTAIDNQTSVTLGVYEGERSKSNANNLLGEFRLDGIPPAPRGVAKFKVCFDIDADGILKVSAEEKASGVKKEMTITNSKGRLSTAQINKMVKDAEECKREDELHRNKVKVMKAFENFAYKMRDTIKDESNAAKLKTDEKEKIQKAFDSAIKWSAANIKLASADDFQKKKEELEKICNPIIAKRLASLN